MITSLQHFALAVPDPDVGRRFYEDFGLVAEARGDTAVLRCVGRAQDQVLLLPGAKKRMHHLALGTTADAIEPLKARLEAARVRLLDPPNRVSGEGLWFHDPGGYLVNVRVAASAPYLGSAEWTINRPGHVARIARRGCPPRDIPVRPRRLGHVLLFTDDLRRQADFYTRVLGMKLSDWCQDIGCFLRCAGDSDHHVVAFFASDRPGFHHASFEVANPDEIGVGAWRMLEKGHKDGWGMGRHVIGSNFFHYVRDPWNTLAEYFCDIDFVPGDADWPVVDWPPEDALYLWGPFTPPDFGANFERWD